MEGSPAHQSAKKMAHYNSRYERLGLVREAADALGGLARALGDPRLFGCLSKTFRPYNAEAVVSAAPRRPLDRRNPNRRTHWRRGR
jgi:hypothetical protein